MLYLSLCVFLSPVHKTLQHYTIIINMISAWTLHVTLIMMMTMPSTTWAQLKKKHHHHHQQHTTNRSNTMIFIIGNCFPILLNL